MLYTYRLMREIKRVVMTHPSAEEQTTTKYFADDPWVVLPCHILSAHSCQEETTILNFICKTMYCSVLSVSAFHSSSLTFFFQSTLILTFSNRGEWSCGSCIFITV